ncbi:hypothetical protein [Streptomyces coeruleorubidus]|uniref:hypothetical protein n=1 Tax=Streptomyces coeruleorubidus TaxID=116188 RepID=UPI0033F0A967
MSARQKIVIIGLCVIVAGGGVSAIVVQSNGDDASTAASDGDSDTLGDKAVEPDPLQVCADSWNDKNENKASVASVATAAQQSQSPTAYVNVGSSAVFPDLCMITVANPATQLAQQYTQETATSWSFGPSWTGSVSQLDPSNLPWNAKMTKDGTIIVL